MTRLHIAELLLWTGLFLTQLVFAYYMRATANTTGLTRTIATLIWSALNLIGCFLRYKFGGEIGQIGEVATGLGNVVFMAFVVWSWYAKRRAKRALAEPAGRIDPDARPPAPKR